MTLFLCLSLSLSLFLSLFFHSVSLFSFLFLSLSLSSLLSTLSSLFVCALSLSNICTFTDRCLLVEADVSSAMGNMMHWQSKCRGPCSRENCSSAATMKHSTREEAVTSHWDHWDNVHGMQESCVYQGHATGLATIGSVVRLGWDAHVSSYQPALWFELA